MGTSWPPQLRYGVLAYLLRRKLNGTQCCVVTQCRRADQLRWNAPNPKRPYADPEESLALFLAYSLNIRLLRSLTLLRSA